MADYKHGEMDISTQEKTFESFVKFTTRTVVVIIVALIFLAFVGA